MSTSSPSPDTTPSPPSAQAPSSPAPPPATPSPPPSVPPPTAPPATPSPSPPAPPPASPPLSPPTIPPPAASPPASPPALSPPLPPPPAAASPPTPVIPLLPPPASSPTPVISPPPSPATPTKPSPPPPPSPPTPVIPSPPDSPAKPSPPPPSNPSMSPPPTPPSSPHRPTPPSPPSGSPPPRPPPSSPISPSSPPPPSSPSSSSISTVLVAGIVAGSVVGLALLGICFFCCWRNKKRKNPQHNGDPYGSYPAKSSSQYSYPTKNGGSGLQYSGSDDPVRPSSLGIVLGFEKSSFTYEELAVATCGFSEANILGKGGFGHVYKGVLYGKEVAIKQLKAGGGQGDREFRTEVEVISRVHHKHLVSLIGYCISGDQRLLVYEFVPNKTLEFHLHGQDQPTMEWAIRYRIALGSAKGLAYLHEDCHPRIIHRDIKAANILIDDNFEPKVADFGLAKLQVEDNTHISTRVVGTFGYMAPEYVNSGRLTEKSDIFSFGVMMLEIITGRRVFYSNHDESLIVWARPLLKVAADNGNYDGLVDPQLKNYNAYELVRLVSCAAACIRQSAQHRPRMSQVLRFLEGDLPLQNLNAGLTPGHSVLHPSDDPDQCREYMRQMMKTAFTSGSNVNSEYSDPTSEYSQNRSPSSTDTDEVVATESENSRGVIHSFQ